MDANENISVEQQLHIQNHISTISNNWGIMWVNSSIPAELRPGGNRSSPRTWDVELLRQLAILAAFAPKIGGIVQVMFTAAHEERGKRGCTWKPYLQPEDVQAVQESIGYVKRNYPEAEITARLMRDYPLPTPPSPLASRLGLDHRSQIHETPTSLVPPSVPKEATTSRPITDPASPLDFPPLRPPEEFHERFDREAALREPARVHRALTTLTQNWGTDWVPRSIPKILRPPNPDSACWNPELLEILAELSRLTPDVRFGKSAMLMKAVEVRATRTNDVTFLRYVDVRLVVEMVKKDPKRFREIVDEEVMEEKDMSSWYVFILNSKETGLFK